MARKAEIQMIKTATTQFRFIEAGQIFTYQNKEYVKLFMAYNKGKTALEIGSSEYIKINHNAKFFDLFLKIF